MGFITWLILLALFIFLCIIGIGILRAQKKIDAPYRGLLLVDHQNEGGPTMVYLQALVDPGTFTDGEEVKLRVRIVKPESHEKQMP